MRTAEICTDCATYISSNCILYSGDYLSALNISHLDSMTTALTKINSALAAQTDDDVPDTEIPKYLGQLFIDTGNQGVWIGLATSGPDWGFLGIYSTTTTTSTTSTTTTAP